MSAHVARELAVWKPFRQEVLKVNVIDPADVVIVHLNEHEIAGKRKCFGGSQSSLLNPKLRLRRSIRHRHWKYPHRVYEPEVVEFAICDASMVGVTEQIVHSVNTKSVPYYDFGEKPFPVSERFPFKVLWPNRQLSNVFGLD